MKLKARLIRNPSDDKQTLGIFKLINNEGKEIFKCHTLELLWNDNKIGKSCIPEGNYKVVPRDGRHSVKFKYPHFHVLGTEPRSWILFHAGNYHSQIGGCILVGSGLEDINGDGYLDVTNSRKTLQKLVDLAPEGFELTIE